MFCLVKRYISCGPPLELSWKFINEITSSKLQLDRFYWRDRRFSSHTYQLFRLLELHRLLHQSSRNFSSYFQQDRHSLRCQTVPLLPLLLRSTRTKQPQFYFSQAEWTQKLLSTHFQAIYICCVPFCLLFLFLRSKVDHDCYLCSSKRACDDAIWQHRTRRLSRKEGFPFHTQFLSAPPRALVDGYPIHRFTVSL